MNNAEAIALQLEIERCLRNREDALAIRLLERVRRMNAEKPLRNGLLYTVEETS